MGLNFRIVDGEYDFDEETYQDFEKDYQFNLDLNANDLMKKYGLTMSKYCKYAREVRTNTGFSRPKKKRSVSGCSDYISMNNDGMYCICKWDKALEEQVYYGGYKELGVAEAVRDRLIECGWDKSQLNKIRAEFGYKEIKKCTNHFEDGSEYIYYQQGGFVIRKSHIYYGRYKDLETAKKVRDKLKTCNWDKSQLNDIKREVGV